MSKLGWLLFSVLFLCACASTQPNWLNTVPSDSAQQFISLGTGPSFAAAQRDALEQLSNRLIVNVESDTRTSNQKSADGSVSQTFSSIGTLQSERFNFVSPTVIDSYQNKQFNVLVAVDKKAVFSTINQFLERQIEPHVSLLESPERIIEQGLALWPKLNKAKQYLSLLRLQGVPNASLDMRLNQFEKEFIEIIQTASIDLVVANTPLNEELNLKSTLNQKYQNLPTEITDPNMRIRIVIVGPQLSEYRDNTMYAARLMGEEKVLINGTLVASRELHAFAVADNEKSARTQLHQKFFNQLIINAI